MGSQRVGTTERLSGSSFLSQARALGTSHAPCWPSPSVHSGHGTKEPRAGKLAESICLCAEAEFFHFLMGLLAMGSFIFCFHSKVPLYNFWQSASLLSTHSFAWSFDSKHISFGESDGFTLQLKTLVCLARCISLILVHRYRLICITVLDVVG